MCRAKKQHEINVSILLILFFLALKVETHLHNHATERKELHVVKIDIKLTPAGDGERPTCSFVEEKS